MTRPEAMRLCREMYGHWSACQIRNYLAEHGVDVSETTARRWGDPNGYGAKTARETAMALERRRSQRIFKTLQQLKGAGLSYRDISVVVKHYHGVELDREQVRHALNTGRPTRAVKAAVRS